MKTIEELIQEALDHGIVDTRDELPYLDVNGNYEDINGAKLRRFLETVLKPAKDTGCPHFTELPDGKVNAKIPPKFLVVLLGFTEARQDNTGAVTLTDVEGGKHTAILDLNIVEMDWIDVCNAVEKNCQSSLV
jgi:hypothetical protein